MSRPSLRIDAAYLASLALAVAVAVGIYWPALGGPFFSDDQHYLFDNPYVTQWSLSNLLAIWNPFAGVAELVENYAPIHLSAHALAWQIFGSQTTGHHVVNVIVHATAAWLLVAVYRRFELSRPVAFGLAAIFLVHPANVEAVAWISQLKTGLSMVFGLGAILTYERRPVASFGLFALGLLAKPTAVFALPVVAVAGAFGALPRARHLRWMGLWLLGFALFALAEFAAFFETAGSAPPLYAELDVRVRTIAAIALRYVVVAATGRGLSLFHEPEPAASWLDPWFVGALFVLAAIGWRLVVSVRSQSSEAVFWLWAAISFAPISGVIPLPYPMADRYLYFMLPGALGGLALALRGVRLPASLSRAPFGVTVCAAFALLFAVQAHGRARLWRSSELLMADAARNYPEGVPARIREADRRIREGDVEGSVRAFRAAMARGYDRLDHLLQDPAYRPHLERAGYREVVDELARGIIADYGSRAAPSQMQWRVIGQAHVVLGELDLAVRALEAAIESGGPWTERTRVELAELRRQQSTRDRVERWKRGRSGGASTEEP